MRQPAAVCWHDHTRYRPEILIGRTLAACVHPFAAWQLLSLSWRVWMLVAYAAIGFFTVLTVLLF
jgi:hypothetical protein